MKKIYNINDEQLVKSDISFFKLFERLKQKGIGPRVTKGTSVVIGEDNEKTYI